MGGVAKVMPKETIPGKFWRGVAGFLEGPEMPEPPKPEAPVEKGEEGIRRGGMQRQAKRRALGQAYLTRGQDRASDMTLGTQRQTLG